VIEDTTTETPLEAKKRRIKASRDAFKSQREREAQDLRFQVPELQWDEDARAARKGGMVNGIQTSPRPVLSINKLDQPIQLVQNQARQAKLGVNIHPVSEKASKETAEILQGLYRRIERDSNADQARLWAFDRASKAGMGAYLVTTKWDEDSPDTFDQEISIDRILYQSMCGFDPNAQKPDFSDGEYSWMGGYITREALKREWPEASLSKIESDSELADVAGRDSDWFQGSGPDRKVLVVTYWYKKHDFEEIKANGRTRKRDKVTVWCCKITATDILEERETDGHLLPLIPVLGRELQPFEAERRWVGMIGPAKDGQRLVNFSAASFVEAMAQEPKNPWVGAEGQFEGHETEWQQANIRPMPYLQYVPKSLGGSLAPPPMRTQVDTSKMQLSVMGMQEGDQMIQSTTSIYDPSLGRNNPRDKSGKAILALQGQSDAGTSHYLASLADVSLAYEARVVLDLIPSIYDRPGRVTRILTGEDKDKMVMLNKPFMPNSEGFPVEAPEGTEGAKMYDLREAIGYSVSTSIGKSFQTRLQQGSEQIGEILANAPDLLPVIGDIYFGYQDIPGSDEIKERMAKWREKVMPGLGEDEDGQAPTVEQLSAKLQAMEQQGQMQGQQLQMAMEQIKTDQAKQQAAMMKAQLDAQTTMQKAQLDAQTAIHQAEMNNATKLAIERIKAGQAAISDASELAEVRLATGLKIQADREARHEEMAHDVAMAHAGGNTVTRKREGGQEQEQEEGREESSGASRQPPQEEATE
jgi:hypothetical protein